MIKSATRRSSWFQRWLKFHFFEKKLNSGLGVVIFSLFAAGISYITAGIDFRFGPLVPIFFAALLLVISCIKFPYFSFYLTIFVSSILYLINRFLGLSLNVPYGVLIEILTYITIVGMLVKQDLRAQITRKFWFNPISICLYMLFGFFIIELFNPEMWSRVGYSNFIRKQLSFFFLYYAAFGLLNSRKRIIFFTYFLAFLSGALGFYTIKQQYLGYAPFEMNSILSSPGTYQLLFQGGFLRKFSTMADPGTSGVYFASMAIFSIILAIRNRSKIMRWFLYAVIFADVLAYSFSGTRTATLILVAGILFYGLATIYEKRTALFLLGSVGSFVMLMVMPYQNVFTNRIKTTFEGTNDPSAAIRDVDRHAIQPYLYEHPFGGGIFTCGDEGSRYNRGHYLSTFQPDSGYMKVLAEQGVIGLTLMLIFYMVVMRQGIRAFYRARDPEIQTLTIAFLVMMFTLLVSQYSQMAVNQYPVSMVFFCSLAVFLRILEFDTPEPIHTPNLQT